MTRLPHFGQFRRARRAGMSERTLARAGFAAEVGDLMDDLRRANPGFDRMWRENQVLSHSDGENVKRLLHPALGPIEMEYSLFAADGRPDLGMIVYAPLDALTAKRIRAPAAQRRAMAAQKASTLNAPRLHDGSR